MSINLQQYGVVIRVAIFPSQLPKYCQTNLKSVAKNLNFYNFTNVSSWSVFSQFTIFPNGFDCSVSSILPSSNRVPSFQRIIMVPSQMGITGWQNPPFSDTSKYHIYIFIFVGYIMLYIVVKSPYTVYPLYRHCICSLAILSRAKRQLNRMQLDAFCNPHCIPMKIPIHPKNSPLWKSLLVRSIPSFICPLNAMESPI